MYRRTIKRTSNILHWNCNWDCRLPRQILSIFLIWEKIERLVFTKGSRDAIARTAWFQAASTMPLHVQGRLPFAFAPLFSEIIANRCARPRSIFDASRNETIDERWHQIDSNDLRRNEAIDTVLRIISTGTRRLIRRRSLSASKPASFANLFHRSSARSLRPFVPFLSLFLEILFHRSSARSLRPFVPYSVFLSLSLSLFLEIHAKRNAFSSDETAALHASLLFAETIDIVYRVSRDATSVRAVPAHATNWNVGFALELFHCRDSLSLRAHVWLGLSVYYCRVPITHLSLSLSPSLYYTFYIYTYACTWNFRIFNVKYLYYAWKVPLTSFTRNFSFTRLTGTLCSDARPLCCISNDSSIMISFSLCTSCLAVALMQPCREEKINTTQRGLITRCRRLCRGC